MNGRGKRPVRRLTIVAVLVVGLPLLVGGCYGSGVTTGVYVGGYPGYGPYGGYGGPYGYPAAYPGRYPVYGGGVVITGYP